MIIKLFCPSCAYEASKILNSKITIDVPVPIEQIKDDGKYLVECEAGHINEVILDNIKLELLFEMGANALIDGYYREAVSSFASSLERFYEFYWHVTMIHFDQDIKDISQTWKPMSKLSERQIGAYSTAVLLLTGKPALLLNSNKEVPFRNNVIHNGYIPTKDEATLFGDAVMKIILTNLEDLRIIAPITLEKVYEQYTPDSLEDANDENKLTGKVNILTCVDIRYPQNNKTKLEDHYDRILRDREPTHMSLLTKEEMEKYLAEKE
ncbi:hypothetical protein [Sulfuricurvum sp.]|uniref:hypothetical protein n=1 Tax=Sulfuricurvum sp. TaxID=2025608 RepID=UPI00356A3E93